MTTRLSLAPELAGIGGPMPPAGAEVPLAPLARMLATARIQLDRHLNESGTCTWCGCPWPCSTACLAEFTLGNF